MSLVHGNSITDQATAGNVGVEHRLRIVIGIAASLLASGYNFRDLIPGALSTTQGSCSIKGNISIDSGEKIYHVPGQEFYSDTVIRKEYGERWFCSESEARAAGWRRSKV